MKKTKIKYLCSNCGYESLRWLGKCPECENWNSFTEEIIEENKRAPKPFKGKIQIQKIRDISANETDRIISGIAEFDRVLGGGLMPGSIILLGGDPGIGKSTLAMHFLYSGAVKYDEPGLYITLEETREKLYEDMAKFGMDLYEVEKAGKFTLIGGPIANIKSYMDKVDAEIKNMVDEIKEVVKERGIKRVVIDSINLLTMLSDNEDDRRKALAVIANTLSSLGCTALLLSETKEGSMDLSRYGIEEFVVDGVIVLYLVRQGSKFISGITVRKMRGTNHDKEIRYYQITDKGIVVYPTETVFTGARNYM